MDWQSMMKWENVQKGVNELYSVVVSMSSKPQMVLILIVALLVASQVIANVLSSMFGLGLVIGALAIWYLIVNYGGKDTKKESA